MVILKFGTTGNIRLLDSHSGRMGCWGLPDNPSFVSWSEQAGGFAARRARESVQPADIRCAASGGRFRRSG